MPVFVAQEVSKNGSSDPITARTTIQTSELIGAFPLSPATRQALVDISFAVRGRLVACRDVAQALDVAATEAIGEIGGTGIATDKGERVITIPGIRDLRAQVETFLYQGKLAIRDIGQLYKPLVGQHFNQNFKEFADWAVATWGSDDALCQMLQTDRPWIGRLISLRDAAEHPTHRRGPLHLANFTVSNIDGVRALTPPSWAQGDEARVPILPEMFTMINNLLTFYEELLAGLLLKLDGTSWLQIIEIPDAERDPVTPIRLRVVPAIALPEA